MLPRRAYDDGCALAHALNLVGERWALLIVGIVLNGIATGMYIGAQAGPGPRDGLMTGLAARGHQVWAVRWGIELTVLAAGFFLGATIGIGTVLYACAIGPLAHVCMPLLSVTVRPLRTTDEPST